MSSTLYSGAQLAGRGQLSYKGRICGDVGDAPASAEAEAHREPEADVDALGAGGGKRTAIG